MPTLHYQAGRARALTKIGVSVNALMSPLLGGSLFGSAAGALTAPEGHRGEGALQGGLYGGLGAAGGSLLGGAAGTFGKNRAAKRLSRVQDVSGKARQRALHRPESPMLGQYGAYNDSWRAKTLKRLEEAAQKDLVAKQQGSAQLQRGAAMLGGVLGAGTGTALTERNVSMSDVQDPYGYRYGYPPNR